MIPKRKKRARSGIRDDDGPIRCLGHLKWVRGHECCVQATVPWGCSGRIHAHHVQSYRAIEGGMGLKVGDDKTVPLCERHHSLVHQFGQTFFEKGIPADLEKTAADLWNASPHGKRYRLGRETNNG